MIRTGCKRDMIVAESMLTERATSRAECTARLLFNDGEFAPCRSYCRGNMPGRWLMRTTRARNSCLATVIAWPQRVHLSPISAPIRVTSQSLVPHACGLRRVTMSPIWTDSCGVPGSDGATITPLGDACLSHRAISGQHFSLLQRSPRRLRHRGQPWIC